MSYDRYQPLPGFRFPAVDFPRGLLFSIAAFAGLRVWEILWSGLTEIGNDATDVSEVAIKVGIDLSMLYLVLRTARGFGVFETRMALWDRIPTWYEVAKWSLLGIGLGIRSFVIRIELGDCFQYPDYVWFLALESVSVGLLMPCIQEIVCRGICFASLRPLGRFQAYLWSTLLFVIWHVGFVQLFLHGTTGLDAVAVLQNAVVGIGAAYAYETTGKLFVCLAFHCAGNFFALSAPVVANLCGLS